MRICDDMYVIYLHGFTVSGVSQCLLPCVLVYLLNIHIYGCNEKILVECV